MPMKLEEKRLINMNKYKNLKISRRKSAKSKGNWKTKRKYSWYNYRQRTNIHNISRTPENWGTNTKSIKGGKTFEPTIFTQNFF